MILLVCESRKLQDLQIMRLASSQYIAFFPSRETRETRETRTDIFAILIFSTTFSREKFRNETRCHPYSTCRVNMAVFSEAFGKF
jgi:hypothetical protein